MVKLTEEKLELNISFAMKLSHLLFALCCSPGQPYLSDPLRIIDHYMGSKLERNKCTTIKKTPSFSDMKPNSNTQVYFSKIP